MEASGAGLATGSETTGDGEAAQGSESQATQQPDLSSQLNDLGTMLEEQRDFLQSEPWNAAQEEAPQEDTPPEIDYSGLEGPETPEAAIESLKQVILGTADQAVQAAVTPLQQQIKSMEIKAASDDLIARYPDFGDPKIAKEVIDAAGLLAEQLGQPALAGEPQIWEAMYHVRQAKAQAASEDASSASGASTLEGAGGASPGGAAQGDVTTTQDITASWRPHSLPLFGGKG